MIAKVQFSPEEKELMKDTNWILTKQKVTEKVYELFGAVYDFQKEKIKDSIFHTSTIFARSGKIYKGENYLGLPYIILDHPAIFNRNDLFVVRTMFWWGNFFSITLHVSGSHQSLFLPSKLNLLEYLQHNNFFICVNEDQWQHHFADDNYLPAGSFSLTKFEEIIGREFFKVSKKIPVAEVENAYDFLVTSFEKIISMVTFNYPDGEKDL